MADNNRSSICEQLQVLRDKVDLLFQGEQPLRKKQRKAKCTVSKQINLIEKLLEDKEELLPLPNAQPKEPKELSPRSMSQDSTKVPKKLLISNGCVIGLLDLNQCENLNDIFRKDDCVQPLPTISTLKLIEKELPVSGGLFKLGSDAYIIGGHDFLADWKPSSDRLLMDCCGGYSLYKAFSNEKYLKGTSRATYRLSLTDDATLIPSKGKIKKLKSPKFWPIVEEIDGQIHVLDSGPWMFHKPDRDWAFSHEVLNRERRQWSKIPTPPLGAFIKSHTVLGNCIYALTGQNKCLVFDAEKKEWEGRECESRDLSYTLCFFMTEVWEILSVGTARCAGKFPLNSTKPVYVVIAIVGSPYSYPEHGKDPDEMVCTHAMAFGLSLTGRAVCTQPLRDFFEGPMQPCRMRTATIIKADAEGKTMCSIVEATSFVDGEEEVHNGVRDRLFVNTFTVKMLSSAAPRIEKHLEADGYFGSEEFVRVVVKDRYIFETDIHIKGIKEQDLTNELIHFPAIQACFV